MAVYVDDMELPADVPNGQRIVSDNWSHLMADTHEELMAAAAKLRLNPKWIQYPGTAKEHFDLTSGKRQQAIKQEIAQPITWRQSGEMYAAKVQTQQARHGAERVREIDYAAGMAYKIGDYTRARELLSRALQDHPGRADLWTSRLDQVEAKAPENAPIDAGIAREAHGPGHHRGGGLTTTERFGTFPRAPEPPEPRYCPGCTTTTERDGKTYISGPKIEAHRELCQGCEVQANARAREALDRSESQEVACDAPNTSYRQSCAKCGEAAPGPGGIICPPCRDEIGASRSPGKVPAPREPERDEVEAAS